MLKNTSVDDIDPDDLGRLTLRVQELLVTRLLARSTVVALLFGIAARLTGVQLPQVAVTLQCLVRDR